MNKNKRGDSSVLDEFYTRVDVAREMVAHTKRYYRKMMRDWSLIVEPSAGDGSFLHRLPLANRRGFDLAPRAPRITQADFLTIDRQDVVGDVPPADVLFIGNPPFGKNGSVARAFIERALEMADHVAFILPQSFQKASTQNLLRAPDVHLVCEHDVPADAFVFRGETKRIPTVFQIWRRMPALPPRGNLVLPTEHPEFAFVRPSEQDIDERPIFSVQRVGGRAGKIITDRAELKRKRTSGNFYFLDPADDAVLLKMQRLDLERHPAKARSAGMPSLAKGEIIAAYDGDEGRVRAAACLCLACNAGQT